MPYLYLSTNRISGDQGHTFRKFSPLAPLPLLLLAACLLAMLIGLALLLAPPRDIAAQIATAPYKPASGVPAPSTCGPDWIVVSSPYSGTNSYLTSVAEITVGQSSLVVAAGYYTNNSGIDRTLLQYWDSSISQWVVYPVAPLNQGTGNNYLTGVAMVGDQIWVVGDYINSSGVRRTLIEHTSAGSLTWTIEPSPNQGGSTTDNYLTGIAAASANNIWAVGYDVPMGIAYSLVEHWDGTQWSVEPTPDQGTQAGNYLAGVTAVSASDVWAVGFYGPGGTIPDGHTLTLHRTGGTWTIVSSPDGDPSSGGRNKLLAVHALSANNISAVGYYNNTSGPLDHTLTLHWNGSAWSVRPSPNPGNQNYNDLYGVVGAQSGDIWAVGDYSDSNITRTLTQHWDGTAWTVWPSPNQSSLNVLYGVTAVSPSDIWAVGTYQTGSSYRTLVERYNPCSGTPTPTRTPGGPTDTPTHTPTPIPSQCALQFEDVPNPSTFYTYIQCLACRGVISGYACGGIGEPCNTNHDPYFRPNNNVTRGQIAKIIALSKGIVGYVSGQTFEDVPPGSTFYTYTEQLYALQAMSGYACGGPGEPCNPPTNRPYFRPNANATRGQLAKIDSNAAGYTDIPSGQTFEDVPPASTFYTYTQRLTIRGVMSGYACGAAGEPCNPPQNRPYFRPNANVTRGQTSKIVANTFYPNCQAPDDSTISSVRIPTEVTK